MSGLYPNHEVVVLTCSDGETYDSRKIEVIRGASALLNFDDEQYVNVTWSGDRATVNINGVTDKTLTLEIWGNPITYAK